MGDFLRDFGPEHIELLKTFLGYQSDFIRGHFLEVLPEEHKPKAVVHVSVDSTSHEQEDLRWSQQTPLMTPENGESARNEGLSTRQILAARPKSAV